MFAHTAPQQIPGDVQLVGSQVAPLELDMALDDELPLVADVAVLDAVVALDELVTNPPVPEDVALVDVALLTLLLELPPMPELVGLGHWHGPKPFPNALHTWTPCSPPTQAHADCWPGTHACPLLLEVERAPPAPDELAASDEPMCDELETCDAAAPAPPIPDAAAKSAALLEQARSNTVAMSCVGPRKSMSERYTRATSVSTTVRGAS